MADELEREKDGHTVVTCVHCKKEILQVDALEMWSTNPQELLYYLCGPCSEEVE